MRVFYLDQGQEALPIDGDNKPNYIRFWRCPDCGRGFGVGGLRYPAFVPSRDGSLELKRLFRKLRALAQPPDFWGALARFRELIAVEDSSITFVPPGTEFGPLRLCVAECVDVACPNMGALVCRASRVEALRRRGLRFATFPTFLQSGQKKVAEPYHEIFAPARAHKARSIPGEICAQCLRFEVGWRSPLPLRADSIPEDVDTFRIFEQPNIFFAKERFANALSEYYGPNVSWKEAPVERQ